MSLMKQFFLVATTTLYGAGLSKVQIEAMKLKFGSKNLRGFEAFPPDVYSKISEHLVWGDKMKLLKGTKDNKLTLSTSPLILTQELREIKNNLDPNDIIQELLTKIPKELWRDKSFVKYFLMNIPETIWSDKSSVLDFLKNAGQIIGFRQNHNMVLQMIPRRFFEGGSSDSFVENIIQILYKEEYEEIIKYTNSADGDYNQFIDEVRDWIQFPRHYFSPHYARTCYMRIFLNIMRFSKISLDYRASTPETPYFMYPGFIHDEYENYLRDLYNHPAYTRFWLKDFFMKFFSKTQNFHLKNILHFKYYGLGYENVPIEDKIKDYLKTKDGNLLQYLPSLADDTEFVKAAMHKDGMALQFASDKLRSDSDVVQYAVNKNGMALQFASDKLRKDPHIVKIAINNDSRAAQFSMLSEM